MKLKDTGLTFQDIKDKVNKYMIETYERFDFLAETADGMYIYDENGTPYLGTSAGSNICGLTMSTTNDMPIVYPPSFDCMGLVPFNINPHYLDPNPVLKHNGETRETRIKEFLTQNDTKVIGLREGNWIRRIHNQITVQGNQLTRIFEKGKEPYEIEAGTLL